MKLSQLIEARHHGQVDLEDPEGWVFSVTEADKYYIEDHAVDFWASEDLGNTVWEMENNTHRIRQTNLNEGIREIYDHGLQFLEGWEQEMTRDEYQHLEYNFDRLFEKYSAVFMQGVKDGNYSFFLVPESDLFSLLALKR